MTKAKADQLRAREKARHSITLVLILLIAITLGIAAFKIGSPDWQQAKDFLLIALPFEAGALGSSIGFYFGTQPPREVAVSGANVQS